MADEMQQSRGDTSIPEKSEWEGNLISNLTDSNLLQSEQNSINSNKKTPGESFEQRAISKGGNYDVQTIVSETPSSTQILGTSPQTQVTPAKSDLSLISSVTLNPDGSSSIKISCVSETSSESILNPSSESVNIQSDQPSKKRERLDKSFQGTVQDELQAKKLKLFEEVEEKLLHPDLTRDLYSGSHNVSHGDLQDVDSPTDELVAEQSSVFNFTHPPKEISFSKKEFSVDGNYLKGCKWAPDGSCLLTCSNDCSLRLFNLPPPLLTGEIDNLAEMSSVLIMKEGETIYDYSWYPLMTSADPLTCCLLSTSANTPIHMWDAFTGDLRCSYRAYNQVDEVTAAFSVAFSQDGTKIFSGFNRTIRIFDIARPGRQCEERRTYIKEGQSGIISCIANSPSEPGLYAAGSYSRTVALYQEPKGDMVCMFEGQQGGITHLQFTPDGTKLLSGGRKDSEILCWDLRNPGRILFTVQRDVQTNQRIYFDIDWSGQYLISGNHDGMVRVWDMSAPTTDVPEGSDPVLEPILAFQGHSDTVNGVSFHRNMPLLATSSGQRHFYINGTDSDEEPDEVDNSLRLWSLGT